MYKCEICGKEFESKFALGPHKRLSHDPSYVKPSNGMTGKPAWNKGLTAETSPSVNSAKETWNKKYSEGLITHSRLGKHVTDQTKSKISKSVIMSWTDERRSNASYIMTKRLEVIPNGTYNGSGRAKQGWYSGIYCNSSWELAFILYCHDLGKSITRCCDVRKYFYEGRERNYHPDFIVDGKIVEIKGYFTEKCKAKNLYNPDIELYLTKDMKPILDYVIMKYGKDFIKLYEAPQ